MSAPHSELEPPPLGAIGSGSVRRTLHWAWPLAAGVGIGLSLAAMIWLAARAWKRDAAPAGTTEAMASAAGRPATPLARDASSAPGASENAGPTVLPGPLGMAGPGNPAPVEGAMVASSLAIAADDFVVDIYVNGRRVPDSARALAAEVFGATGERVQATVREGDWLVFNVVNNRLRWGGACYFGLAGLADDGSIAFVSEVSDQWSVCENPALANRFIGERSFLVDQKAQAIERRWTGGDKMMAKLVSGWSGQPIWGAETNRNLWLKFNVPGAR